MFKVLSQFYMAKGLINKYQNKEKIVKTSALAVWAHYEEATLSLHPSVQDMSFKAAKCNV